MSNFKQHSPSNAQSTCLWCGTKLRPSPYAEFCTTVKPVEEGPCDVMEGSHGAYGDNAFCTMRCGHRFGANAARLGFRFDKARVQVPRG